MLFSFLKLYSNWKSMWVEVESIFLSGETAVRPAAIQNNLIECLKCQNPKRFKNPFSRRSQENFLVEWFSLCRQNHYFYCFSQAFQLEYLSLRFLGKRPKNLGKPSSSATLVHLRNFSAPTLRTKTLDSYCYINHLPDLLPSKII